MNIVAFALVAATVSLQPLSEIPADDASDGVDAGFGQLVGPAWNCQGSSAQPDGSWKDGPGKATWLFQYALEGHAVQDFWYPPAAAQGAPGTNLRTYDAENDRWYMVWATAQQARFDHFEATVADGMIVMTGRRWARQAFPEHDSRITFYNMSDTHFDWKYESAATSDGPWQEISRIACDRGQP